MKVLHLIDAMGLGGAQSILKAVLERQANDKSVYLYSLRKKKIRIDVNHANVFEGKSGRKYSFSELKKIKDIVMREKIDVLHCHLFKSQLFGYILKKRHFPNIKLIFHEHGEIFQRHLIYNAFMRLAAKDVDMVIAVSNTTKDKLISAAKIPKGKIQVLHNFVDLERFKPSMSKDLPKRKEFVIGYVGRLSKVKGCEYLISSLVHLNHPYRLIIAGDGPEKERLASLSKRLRVDKNITFKGYVKEVEKIYPKIDLLVMPSLSEASPMTFYEALASGKPVIGSNVASLNEFIIDKKNGLLFRPRDPIDLAHKINFLLDNSDKMARMRNYALRTIKDRSLDNYLKELSMAYDKLR